MSTDHARTASLVDFVRDGAPTDPEVKDEAFRLWIELGRSWAAVHRRTGIAVRTLHQWGSTDRWEDRRRDQAAAFLPGRKTETAINLRMAAHSASVRLAELMLMSAEQGIDPDPKVVDALTKAIASGGYSSVGTRNPLDGLDQPEKTGAKRTKFSDLDPLILADRERKIRGGDDDS